MKIVKKDPTDKCFRNIKSNITHCYNNGNIDTKKLFDNYLKKSKKLLRENKNIKFYDEKCTIKSNKVILKKLQNYKCNNKKQYVLGRTIITGQFCNNDDYLILHTKKWSLTKNDAFIKNISSDIENKIVCNIIPIIIFVNDKNNKNLIPTLEIDNVTLETTIKKGMITAREICLLIHLGYKLYFINNNNKSEKFVIASKKSKYMIEKKINNKNITLKEIK